MLVRVAPILGLGLVATIVGYQLSIFLPFTAKIYLQGAFLVLLISMVIMDTEPGWNVVLFLGFGLVAGINLRWSGADLTRLRTWIFFLSLFLCSLTGGALLKRDTGRAAGILFLSTFLYMIGWFLFILTTQPESARTIWIILGLVLFTLVAIAVISKGLSKKDDSHPLSLSIQLFLVFFNLFWLSGMFLK